MQIKSNWIKILDPLRTLFAFWVLFSHLDVRFILIDVLGQTTLINKVIVALGGTFFCGIGAVICFFVLSGLVIHLPFELGKQFDLKKFYIARITRVFIPLVVACCIMQFLLGRNYEELPIWSLICELVYYLIYPLLRKLNELGIKFITMTVVSYIVATIILIYCGVFNSNNTGYIFLGYYITWIIGFPCWLIGVLLAQWYANNTIIIIPIVKVWYYRISAIIFSQIAYLLFFKIDLSIAISFNFLAIFFFFWFKAEIRNAYFVNRNYGLLGKMSKWSYSLYLTHTISFILVNLFLNDFTHSMLLSAALKIIVSIAFALLFSWLIETPSHLLARKLSE